MPGSWVPTMTCLVRYPQRPFKTLVLISISLSRKLNTKELRRFCQVGWANVIFNLLSLLRIYALHQTFSILALLTSGVRLSYWEGLAMPSRMFIVACLEHLWFYPQEARSSPLPCPSVTTKPIFKCQMYPGGQNCPYLRTTSLDI